MSKQTTAQLAPKKSVVFNGKLHCFVILLLLGSFLNGQNRANLTQSGASNYPITKELDSILTQYTTYNPVEKVYLHTDRDVLIAGETLWYSGYTVLGPDHKYSLASKVIHLDLIGPNNTVLISQTHELVEGKAIGSLVLRPNLVPGKYQLRAYTNWMRNFDHDFFFTKTIQIVGANDEPQNLRMVDDKIDLQFLPEGGHSVAGLMGQVAFKAVGSDGLDRKIKGYVRDSQGNPVAHLGTITRGSGFFHFTPKSGERYTAILDNGTAYPLPEIKSQGYAMSINNTSQEHIKINIQATAALRKDPFYILGHINNKKYFQGTFAFENRETISIEIPKSEISSGVLAFTLFDQHKKPWCERAVFINNQQGLVINAKINPEKIAKRNEIEVDIKVTDAKGNPVSTELSMAITDMGQVAKNPYAGNILTHLLLQSDIKGHIQNPGLLFKDQNRLTLHALDLVMLTHGWRKFSWQKIQKDSLPPKKFKFAQGLTVSGQARNKFNKRFKNVALNVIAKSGDNVGMFSAKTERDGKFQIPNFNLKGTTRIVFNAVNSVKKPMDVKVVLDTNKIATPLSHFKSMPTVKDTAAAKKYSDFSATRKNMRLLYDYENTTELEEVVVTEKVVKRIEASMPSILGQTPDATLRTKDTRETGLSLMDLISRFVGVTVYGSFPYIAVSIRGGGSPLWVLNGVPLRQDKGSVPPQIASMDISNVERVELLKGPASAIWGSRGGNGVFLVYTKRGGGAEVVLAPEFDIMGHAIERTFYAPNYNAKLDKHSQPDYRATLYWNPSFQTNEDGKVSLKFFNSDAAKQLQVSIEGLSANGTSGACLKTFGEKDEKL